MISDSVKHLFPQLLRNGYVPIPNRDKHCYLPKWSRILVDEEQCRRWARQTRWPAIGLRVEPPLLVIDFDIPDVTILEAVEAITPSVFFDGLERIGNAPKTALFLRLSTEDEPFHRLKTRRFLRDKTVFAVEAFGGGGGGKQIGSFGPHSHDENGAVLRRYWWVDERSPANVPISELPEVRRSVVADFIDRVDAVLERWPGLTVDLLSRKGEKFFNHHEYDLIDGMIFRDADGVEYTLAELEAEAKARHELKQPPLRVTGSFTDDPTSGGSARCKVHWGRRHGLSITDFKTDITHHVLRVPADPELDRVMRDVMPSYFVEHSEV